MEYVKLLLKFIDVLIWPVVVIYCLNMFKDQIGSFFARMEKADLPGGISLKAFQEEIKLGKELSVEVREEKSPKQEKPGVSAIPINEANARMLNLGLAPSPSGLELSEYRILAQQDPNLALAGIRMEIEIMLKNLAKGFEISIKGGYGAGIIAKKLSEQGKITQSQTQLISTVIKLCNSAVHGHKVTLSEAEDILDISEILRDDYISWLSWGFPDK
ncbi:MAG: DUF4145 domain-containing protein [Nitrospinales bacterium]